jgi:hypothetical protein
MTAIMTRAILALASQSCLAADTQADMTAVDFKQEIEADWLRQLMRDREPYRRSLISPEVDAAGACDGVKDEATGFHTDRQENPWWQVDLGSPERLARIVVYNATECPERARNLRLLLSEDGKTWQEAYRHDGQVFGGAKDGKPLVVQLKGGRARFVRAALPGTEYLHLDEVEVYGTEVPERNLALGKAATQSSVSRWSTAPAGPKPSLQPELMKLEIPRTMERAESCV